MVWDRVLFRVCGPIGGYGEMFVDLHRVAVDDLSPKPLTYLDGQLRLSDTRGADHNHNSPPLLSLRLVLIVFFFF